MDPTLIICIDGLGKDLISKGETPFLYEFGKTQYLAELETLFAFTGIEYTFFTGQNPDKQKIWLEFSQSKNSIFKNKLIKLFSFNKKLRTYLGAIFQIIKRRTYICGLHNIPKNFLQYFDSSVKKGLWELPYFQKKKFVFYKWPFFISDKKIKIIPRYENDNQRLKRLLKNKNQQIYYTQLMEIDKTIHKFKKRSKETQEILKSTDKTIQKFTKKFLKENKKGKVFIWSDHGFADIKKYFDIEAILPKRKDYLYFIAGTTISFWFKSDKRKEEIKKILSKIKGIELLNKKIAKKYKIPFNGKYGDLIYYTKKENYIFPNFYQKSLKEKFNSMHGYPDDKELNGFLISNKKIPKKLKMSEVINLLQ